MDAIQCLKEKFKESKLFGVEKDKSFHSSIGQIYPELLAQAREYAEGTIVDPEEHNDAVDSCICDFMEGARAAMFYKTDLSVCS